MTDQATSLFDTGIERYKAGESPETLIPLFKEICTLEPKDGTARSCLAWLYMLDNKSAQALKAAQKAVKLNPTEPQARVNLAIAMLENRQTGVRQQIEAAQQLMTTAAELETQIQESLEEGLARKPDWDSLKRVKNWLFSS